MPSQKHPTVAREGWSVIATSVAAGGGVWFVNPEWTVAFLALAFILVLKFRDPVREVPPEPLGVVSPVDGIVESIEQVMDPCLDREAIRVRLLIHRFGAYSARAPVEGKVLAFKATASGQRGMRIHTDEGDEVLLILNAAPSFARPRALVGYGARIGQGQRCALLRLARIAEVYLPVGTRVTVEEGRRVLAGTELLGVLVHD